MIACTTFDESLIHGATGGPSCVASNARHANGGFKRSLQHRSKRLSVNYIYDRGDLSERNDRRCKMVGSEEAAFEFLIAHEELAKAIEPTMGDLHNPPSGSLRRVPPLLLGFLPAPFDMGNVAVLFNGRPRRLASIASIGTQVLAASLRRRGTLHHDGVEDGSKLADIMSVCPGHDDRQRDATTVHQQMTLASIFSPDPSGLARRFLEPVAPSSLPRRHFAIATRCLPGRHTRPARPSTALRTPRLSATRDSVCELRSRYRSARSAAPSTDSPCATQTRCPRTPAAHPWVCARHRVCARSSWPSPVGAPESRVRPAPKRHRTPPMPATYFSSHVSPSLTSHIRLSRDGRSVYYINYG